MIVGLMILALMCDAIALYIAKNAPPSFFKGIIVMLFLVLCLSLIVLAFCSIM